MAIAADTINETSCGCLCHTFTIVEDDAEKFLAKLPDKSYDLVFLDPPFNLGKSYGNLDSNQDKKTQLEYFDFLESICQLSSQKVKVGGALYFYNLPINCVHAASVLNNFLDFRHWIAVSMKNRMPIPNKLYPAHYGLLYYTNGAPATFNRPKIEIQKCRHCQKPIKDYGGYKKYMADGVNLSDVWDDLSPVRHRNKKLRVENELPEVLYERILSISGIEGGSYLEPFFGTGKGLNLAFKNKMSVTGCDLNIHAVSTLKSHFETQYRGSASE